MILTKKVKKGVLVKSKISYDLAKPGRIFALKQILLSLIIVVISCILSWAVWDDKTSFSMFIGGMVAIIPRTVFAFKAFKYAGATASEKVVDAFFSGVKIKMVLSAVLFALAFKFLVIVPIPFFVMFCVVMVLPLLQPLFTLK